MMRLESRIARVLILQSLVGCVRFARPQQHAIVAPPLSATAPESWRTKQRGYIVVLTANIIWAPLKQEGMQQAK
jgi:hypothetical protein